MENTKDKMSSENIDNQDGGKVPQREKKGQGFRLEHWHIIALGLMLYDSLALSFSYLIALWLRYDLRYSTIDTIYIERWKAFLPFYILGSLAVFWFLKLYKSIWRFASYSELLRVSMATVICSFFHIIGITFFWGRMPFPTTSSGQFYSIWRYWAFAFPIALFCFSERSITRKAIIGLW